MKKTINKNNIFIALVLLGLIFVASLPAFRSGIYQGHDLSFHLGRIQAIAEELKNGQFPVRYESNAWYGHGYVSTTFYGNIFLYIPAFLYMAGLPVWRAYNVYVILVNVFTALIGYYSFKGILKSERWGLVATGIYMLAGYRLSNLYVRTALGEYTAMIFVPLVIYGIYRIYVNKGEYSTIKLILPLIIGTTGLIESHILTTELIAVFVFIYALVNIKRTIACIKELLIALAAILGINAFFLIPFIDAYTSMDLYINTELSQTSIRSDGLYLSQLFGILTTGKGSSYPWTTEGEGYLNVGIIVILCIVAALVLLIRDIINKNANKNFIILFAFGIFAAWMSTVYFPWDAFAGSNSLDQLISSVQYPWRYVMILTICFTICGVYAISQLLSKINFAIVFCVIGAIAVLSTGVFDYTLSWGNITVANQDADETWADKLYLPVGTDRDSLSNTEIIKDDESGTVTLPVLAYDNLHVYDSQNNEIQWTVGDNNCIQVTYDGDYTKLYTRFVEPLWWRGSEVISAISIVVLVVIYQKEKRTKNNGK